jgi:hypothetical protein
LPVHGIQRDRPLDVDNGDSKSLVDKFRFQRVVLHVEVEKLPLTKREKATQLPIMIGG